MISNNLEALLNLEREKEAFLQEKERIDFLVRKAIEEQDEDILISMSGYWETPIGIDMISVYSECRQLSLIANIMSREKEQTIVEDTFLYKVSDYSEIFRKYNRTVFYLRRLEMGFGEESREDILRFLTEEKISYICVCTLCTFEVLAKKDKIIMELYKITKGTVWELQAVYSMLCWLPVSKDKDRMLLVLAEYEVEKGNIVRACEYLKQIKEPDQEVLKLIGCLEDLYK